MFDHPSHEKVLIRCGKTRQAEEATKPTEERFLYEAGSQEQSDEKQRVCVLWNHVPEEITAAKSTYKFIMTVDRDLLVAEQEMRNGKKGQKKSRLDSVISAAGQRSSSWFIIIMKEPETRYCWETHS